MFSGNDQGLPQVPYATALELYVQMCFTFLILSMFEFVGVHYFTKHGGGDYHNIGKFFRVTILKSFLFLHYRGLGPSFTLKSTMFLHCPGYIAVFNNDREFIAKLKCSI